VNESTDTARVWLTRLSLAAGMVYTASAEYQLARTLGANEGVAAMLPVAIDAYVIAALRWFRSFDIALSLALMGTAQVAAHLLDAGVMTVNITMVVVVSLLVPVSIWRTHALARTTEAVPEAVAVAAVPDAPAVSVERVPERPRVRPPAPVPAVLEAVPAAARMLPIVARPDDDETAFVSAAEWTRTRPELHAEYVPDPVPDDEPAISPDPLTSRARARFADMLAADQVPGVRTLRTEYNIGQPRAQRIRDELVGAS
jgi:hypothetical protein